jgi:hypothetical protein
VAADEDNVYALVLVGDDEPANWNVLRSNNGGDSWNVIHSTSSAGAVEPSFFGVTDGKLVLAVPAIGQTAVFVSSDQGDSFDELTPVPSAVIATFVIDGNQYLATGGSTHRSTNAGQDWEAISGTSFIGILSAHYYESEFWGLDAGGARYTLANDSTEWGRPDGGPLSATSLWLDEGDLWLKSTGAALFSSSDGVAWTEETTVSASEFDTVLTPASGNNPWLLTAGAPRAHFISSDKGATLDDITEGYPVDENDALCVSTYAVTVSAVYAVTLGGIAGAQGCRASESDTAGLYRFIY